MGNTCWRSPTNETDSATVSSSSSLARRHIAVFLITFSVAFLLFWRSLVRLFSFSFDYEHYSHLALIPLVVLYLIWSDRKRIFSKVSHDICKGAVLLAVALSVALFAGAREGLSENDLSFYSALAWVWLIWGLFLIAFGYNAARLSTFPLLFMAFALPIPDVLLTRIIFWLQVGSSWFTHQLFLLSGVPVFREGFVFALPNLTIEVAEECSGIRSSLALLITAVLAGHLFLQRRSSCWALALAVIPITLFKNGLRIVTLSLLTIYVSPEFMTGGLHQQGGKAFFVVGLVLLGAVLFGLRSLERRGPVAPHPKAQEV